MDRETLFRESDVIALHCPLFPDTEGLINRENIRKMKDGVIILNNSRGQLVVEKDLAEALNSGKVYAAGLDVVSTGRSRGQPAASGEELHHYAPYFLGAERIEGKADGDCGRESEGVSGGGDGECGELLEGDGCIKSFTGWQILGEQAAFRGFVVPVISIAATEFPISNRHSEDFTSSGLSTLVLCLPSLSLTHRLVKHCRQIRLISILEADSPLICHGVAGVGCHIDAQPCPSSRTKSSGAV